MSSLTARELYLAFFLCCCFTLPRVWTAQRNLLDEIIDPEVFGVLDVPNELSGRVHHNDSSASAMRVIDSKKSRKKTAMCTIAVEEEAYLDEFVDYHFALGFDKFFIYDNSEGFELNQWGKLKGDHVEVIHLPGEEKQMPAYKKCTRMVKSKGSYEWAAYFDVDEFLVLKKHDHVADMLDEYCPRGALVINWFIFETNAWNVQSPQPITRRFLYRRKKIHDHIKIIARVDDIKKANGLHAHRIFKDTIEYKDTNGKPYTDPYFNPNGPVDVAVLHHYKTKSGKEYVQKRERGTSDNKMFWKTEKFLRIAKEYFADFLAKDFLPRDAQKASDWELVFDDSAWQFLKTRIPAYALYDKFAVSPFINNGDL